MANEKRRLTDIDALIESTKKFAVNFYVSWTQERVLAWINGAPTVDAVEITRCEQCVHGEVDDPDFPDQFYCHEGCGWNNRGFFCSYGEKRESGTQPQREDV